MRKLLVALFSFCAVVARAQQDRRAPVDGIFTVTPGGKLLLIGDSQQIFYTFSPEADWHKGPKLENTNDKYGGDYTSHIRFFCGDTGIICGYISGNTDPQKKSGYYLTTDAGNSWTLLDFDGSEWIYDVYTGDNGNGWMGGSSGNIWCTRDHGLHWEKRNTPFDGSTRLNAICMRNEHAGVAGALFNALYTTNDNWSTSSRIPTPYDQLKGRDSIDECRIDDICLWKNYILATQCGQVFYTDTGLIRWQRFPGNISNCKLDKKQNVLVALRGDHLLVRYNSLTDSSPLCDSALYPGASGLHFVRNSIFLQSKGRVLELRDGKLKGANPYTPDMPIESPYNTSHATNLYWGIDGTELYFSDDGKDGYRDSNYVLPKPMYNLSPETDSTAIFWDEDFTGYLFHRKDNSLKPYTPSQPLSPFLSKPVKKLVISIVSSGCFHHVETTVAYEASPGGKLTSNTYYKDGPEGFGHTDRQQYTFKRTVSAKTLDSILAGINEHPEAVPGISDFGITAKERKDFPAFAAKVLKIRKESHHGSVYAGSRYKEVPAMLDTISTGTIKKLLDSRERIVSTSSMQFRVLLINQNKDTLQFSRHYYQDSKAWHLPLLARYQGKVFKCYPVSLARYLYYCLPGDFMEIGWFDNKQLMMELGDNLQQR